MKPSKMPKIRKKKQVSNLLDAQKFWIIKNHEDAADDGPAQEVQYEAEQGEPDTPGGVPD